MLLNGMQEVAGSSPASSTFKHNGLTDLGLAFLFDWSQSKFSVFIQTFSSIVVLISQNNRNECFDSQQHSNMLALK